MAESITLRMRPNSAYGGGQFVRALEIRQTGPQHYAVGMEDAFHAMLVHFAHDGAQITEARGEWIRAPLSGCLGAPSALQAMIGAPLSSDLRALGNQTDIRQQCTHLFDVLRIGIAHAAQGRPDRRTDVIVPDATEGVVTVRLFVDGVERRQISILKPDMTIYAPEAYRGAPFLQGFAAWAHAHIDDAQYEEFFLMQRAFFVSAGRRADMISYYGTPAPLSGPPTGSCFGSQSGRFEQGVRHPNALMDSLTPDMLLRFMPMKSAHRA